MDSTTSDEYLAKMWVTVPTWEDTCSSICKRRSSRCWLNWVWALRRRINQAQSAAIKAPMPILMEVSVIWKKVSKSITASLSRQKIAGLGVLMKRQQEAGQRRVEKRCPGFFGECRELVRYQDRKRTRLNYSHVK